MDNTRIRIKRLVYSSGTSGENVFFRVYNSYDNTWLDGADGVFKNFIDVVQKDLPALELNGAGVYSYVEQRKRWGDHDYLVILYIDGSLKLSRLMTVSYDTGAISFSKAFTGEVANDVNVVNMPSVSVASIVASRVFDSLSEKLEGVTTDDFAVIFDLDMGKVDSIGLMLKNAGTDNPISYEITGRKNFNGDVEILMWSGNMNPNEVMLKDLGARYGRLQIRVKSANAGLSSAWKFETQYLKYV